MQIICTLLQTDKHASTAPLSFYRPDAFLPPYQQHQSTEGNEKYAKITRNEAQLLLSFKVECGPMLNVMVALPNIGGALCSTLQSLACTHCSTAMQ